MGNSLRDDIFKSIVDDTILCILVFDFNSKKCLYMNKVAFETFEVPMTTKIDNVYLGDFFASGNRGEFRALSMEICGQPGIHQDLLLEKSNKQLIVANVGITHIGTLPHAMIVLMVQEMTFIRKIQKEIVLKQNELKLAYEELLDQNRRLRELDLAKNRFFALMTHELRTPLSAIIATADVLRMNLYDSEKQRSDFTQIIFEQGQHLSALVNDILDYTKIQAGKIEYYIEYLSLESIIHQTIESLKTFADSKSVQLLFLEKELQIEKEECLCYYDPFRFKQILTNIIGNAIKYNFVNGKVEIWIESFEMSCKIHIKDTGQGIKKEDQEKIFNEFETIENLNQHHAGTGLGLPISKKLIEGMGGGIEVTSEIGKGSAFILEIPKTKILSDTFYRQRPNSESWDLAS